MGPDYYALVVIAEVNRQRAGTLGVEIRNLFDSGVRRV